MMDRRRFIGAVAGGLLAAPRILAAQPPAKVWRIGLLSAITRQSFADIGYYGAFVQGMREHGYVEGRNLAIAAADGRFTPRLRQRSTLDQRRRASGLLLLLLDCLFLLLTQRGFLLVFLRGLVRHGVCSFCAGNGSGALP
jgi:hypothetical protein